MKLTATLARSLRADMQAEVRDIERAVASGTRQAGQSLKTELRRQVTSAGLRQRLANSCQNQLRLAPSGHVIGIDVNAALKIGAARDYDLAVLSELLPAAEAGVVKGGLERPSSR
jgi:Family of unknown function (DUF6441)